MLSLPKSTIKALTEKCDGGPSAINSFSNVRFFCRKRSLRFDGVRIWVQKIQLPEWEKSAISTLYFYSGFPTDRYQSNLRRSKMLRNTIIDFCKYCLAFFFCRNQYLIFAMVKKNSRLKPLPKKLPRKLTTINSIPGNKPSLMFFLTHPSIGGVYCHSVFLKA